MGARKRPFRGGTALGKRVLFLFAELFGFLSLLFEGFLDLSITGFLEGEDEFTVFAILALDPDLLVVGIDDGLGNVEAQSDTGLVQTVEEFIMIELFQITLS